MAAPSSTSDLINAINGDPSKWQDTGVANWKLNRDLISDAQLVSMGDMLCSIGQAHLFLAWGNTDSSLTARKISFLQQLQTLEHSGVNIQDYANRGRDLLKKAALGANPYEGYEVEEPKSGCQRFDTSSQEGLKMLDDFEKLGVSQVKDAAFVVVAGGLGERLGFNGIKLSLPCETITMKSFLQVYCEHILAFQERAREENKDDTILLPLGIMTSDDTDKATRELLESNNYFGMEKDKTLFIFKQEKVPCLLNNDAHFACHEQDPFVLDTKPHGHGDVHSLLWGHKDTMLIEKWTKMNKKWVVFFQDTNGLVFRAVPAALGVSVQNNLSMNSIVVPRRQGDAVGAICKLKRKDAPSKEDDRPQDMTISVEYNQLEALLGKSEPTYGEGDKKYSVYPGNTNVFILQLPEYSKVLKKTNGNIAEFVNPKYKDASKNLFKKPTRLECMMQDLAKSFAADQKVGFSQFEQWMAFSPVKNALVDGAAKQKAGNAPETASSGEADIYAWIRRVLSRSPAISMEDPALSTFKNITVSNGAKIILSPNFGLTQAEILSRFNGKISMTNKCVLVLEGRNISLDGNVVVNGAIEVYNKSVQNSVVLKDLNVDNEGYSFVELSAEDEKKVTQAIAIRGYVLDKHNLDCVFECEGSIVLNDENVKKNKKTKL